MAEMPIVTKNKRSPAFTGHRRSEALRTLHMINGQTL